MNYRSLQINIRPNYEPETDKYADGQTHKPQSTILEMDLFKKSLSFIADTIYSLGQERAALQPVVVVKDPVYGDENFTATLYLAPGFMITCTYMTVAVMAGLSILKGRVDGTTRRSMVQGELPTDWLAISAVCASNAPCSEENLYD
jgi:hypothetical protein